MIADPVPVLVNPTPATFDDEAPAVIHLAWGDPATLVAPPWTGMVTSVAGVSTLRTGSEVAVVDAVVRIAAHTEAPFHRSLKRGHKGSDVAELQTLLSSLGFVADDDVGVFGRRTEAAVRELSTVLGFERSTRVFDPAWVVWLPQEPFPVADFTLTVGTPAPFAGAVVAESPSVLLGASVERVTSEGTGEQLTSGTWVFRSDTVEMTFKAGSSLPDDVIKHLGTTFDSETTHVTGQVVRTEPLEVVVVPLSAVVTDTDGHTCVLVSSGNGFASTLITPLPSGPGTAAVTESLGSSDRVLANPFEMFGSPACV
ncbi:MAG: peptidoglycan-binding domain-containing protein [Actinomycetota bacterium]